MHEETISRDVAIGRIRTRMLELCESGKSACQIATERNILCSGFQRDSDDALRRRYAAYVGGADRISRCDLERAANHWHLMRQRTEEELIACDVQCRYNQVCRGWRDFSNEELSNFCFELSGAHPNVIDKITSPTSDRRDSAPESCQP